MVETITRYKCLINYNNIAEYGIGCKLSTEGDVYSYGIIILEMLTGKRPTDEMFSNGLTLHKFVEKAFPQEIHEVLDPSIIPIVEDGDVEEDLEYDNCAMAGIKRCIMQLIKIGISCSVETPKDRPTMKDVYAEVITINETFSELCH
jgi:serine/threonine protein kinase